MVSLLHIWPFHTSITGQHLSGESGRLMQLYAPTLASDGLGGVGASFPPSFVLRFKMAGSWAFYFALYYT